MGKIKGALKKTIKTLNKGVILEEKTKKLTSGIKEKIDDINDKENVNDYVSKNMDSYVNNFKVSSIQNLKKVGSSSINKTKENFKEIKEKVKNIKTKNSFQKNNIKFKSIINRFKEKKIKNQKINVTRQAKKFKKTT